MKSKPIKCPACQGRGKFDVPVHDGLPSGLRYQCSHCKGWGVVLLKRQRLRQVMVHHPERECDCLRCRQVRGHLGQVARQWARLHTILDTVTAEWLIERRHVLWIAGSLDRADWALRDFVRYAQAVGYTVTWQTGDPQGHAPPDSDVVVNPRRGSVRFRNGQQHVWFLSVDNAVRGSGILMGLGQRNWHMAWREPGLLCLPGWEHQVSGSCVRMDFPSSVTFER